MPPAINKMAWHVFAWATYTAVGIAVFGYRMGLKNAVPETLISFSISALIFYSHYYVLKWTLGKKRRVRYVVSLIILLGVNFLLKLLFFTVLYSNVFNQPASSTTGISIVELFLSFTWQSITFFLFSAGYWFADELLKRIKLAHESDKLKLENAALRAQINPHFLFNTLDSFRIESKSILPEMSMSIASLIELLRSAFATPDDNGLVDLNKEVKVVDSLVNIYRRRFPYLQLQYRKDIPQENIFKIPPHVLLTFVENAFKHGDFTDSVKPLRIDLSASKKGLELRTFNKKDLGIKDDSHGIGMNYIVHQLENCYSGRYKLSVQDTEDEYNVNLKIAWL